MLGSRVVKICANLLLTKSAASGIMENSRQVERLPRAIISYCLPPVKSFFVKKMEEIFENFFHQLLYLIS
jgi:hypothetical protein